MSQRYSSTYSFFKECLEYHVGPELVHKHKELISLQYNSGASVDGTVYRIEYQEFYEHIRDTWGWTEFANTHTQVSIEEYKQQFLEKLRGFNPYWRD